MKRDILDRERSSIRNKRRGRLAIVRETSLKDELKDRSESRFPSRVSRCTRFNAHRFIPRPFLQRQIVAPSPVFCRPKETGPEEQKDGSGASVGFLIRRHDRNEKERY